MHNNELINQTAKSFDWFELPYGIIAGGAATAPEQPVQIAMVQTLHNRIDKFLEPNLLVIDECHHSLAPTYLDIARCYSNANLLGLTATPIRYGGITLHEIFDTMIELATPRELIDFGWLADFDFYSSNKDLHLDKVKIVNGDYNEDDLEKVMGTSLIIADVIKTYKLRAAGKQAICYCVNIRHAKLMASRFNAAGISAKSIDGNMNKFERAQVIEDFRNGKFDILCNVNLLGEGFDVPSVGVCILARPTLSLSLYIQQSSRALRIDPKNTNKSAIILDHAQCYEKFGRPDSWHNWSLKDDGKDEKQYPARQEKSKKCERCGYVARYGVDVCPNCGNIFPARVIVENHAEELNVVHGYESQAVEYARKVFEYAPYHKNEPLYKTKQALKLACSRADFVTFAKILGYSGSWADDRWRLKQSCYKLLQAGLSKRAFLRKVRNIVGASDFFRILAEELYNYWQTCPQTLW